MIQQAVLLFPFFVSHVWVAVQLGPQEARATVLDLLDSSQETVLHTPRTIELFTLPPTSELLGLAWFLKLS